MARDTFAMPAAVIEKLPMPVSNGQAAPDVDYAIVGTFLKARMAAAGITQTALATRLGVDTSAVSRALSNGKGSLILKIVEAIAPEALPPEDVQLQMGVPEWWLAAFAHSRMRGDHVNG